MGVNIDEAKTWSVERLKFEIETRRQDIEDAQRELSDFRAEYAADPDGWGGDYPGAFDFLPLRISRNQAEIEELRKAIRSKL